MRWPGSASNDRKNSEGGKKRKRDDRDQGRAAVFPFFLSESLYNHYIFKTKLSH